jgi:DNA polymerase III alpha subunit
MLDKVMQKMGLTDKQKEFIKREKSKEIIDKTDSIWQVVEDASGYAFNASHSYSVTIDSLYTAWIKAHYPIEFYETTLEMFSVQKDTEKVAKLKDEAFRYKGIKVVPMRFGQDNRGFKAIYSDNSISQSLMGVKGLNSNTAEIIYQIGQEYKGDSFYEVYILMKERGLSKTHISNMLKIDYFANITSKRKGLWLVDNYDSLNKKQISKDKISDVYGTIKDYVDINIMDFYNLIKDMAIKETAKLFKLHSDDTSPLPKIVFDMINVENGDALEEYFWEYSLLGTVSEIKHDVIMGTVVKYNPKTNKIVFKNVATGVESWMAISDENLHVKEKNIVFIESFTSKMWRKKEYWTIQKGINLSEIYKK